MAERQRSVDHMLFPTTSMGELTSYYAVQHYQATSYYVPEEKESRKDSIPKHPLPDGGPMIACQLHGRARRDKFLLHATLFAPSKPSGLTLMGSATLAWHQSYSYKQYFVRTRYYNQGLIGSCHGLSDIIAHTYTKCMSTPRWTTAACTDYKSMSSNGMFDSILDS